MTNNLQIFKKGDRVKIKDTEEKGTIKGISSNIYLVKLDKANGCITHDFYYNKDLELID